MAFALNIPQTETELMVYRSWKPSGNFGQKRCEYNNKKDRDTRPSRD